MKKIKVVKKKIEKKKIKKAVEFTPSVVFEIPKKQNAGYYFKRGYAFLVARSFSPVDSLRLRFIKWRDKIKQPESERYWTTLYYGHRGSCKSLYQANQLLHILRYLSWLYKENPDLKKAIVFTVQKMNDDIEKQFGVYSYKTKKIMRDDKEIEVLDFKTRVLQNKDGLLYYWNDVSQLRYCPRPNCWRGNHQHRLHGAYVIFDDMATILPANDWARTPLWLKKTFAQARHFGIRIIANCQDPFSVDINFRRYTDICYRFKKMFGTKDPDETKPKVGIIFGCYLRRKIKAEMLWQLGDMTEEEISVMKERQRQDREVNGTRPIGDLWKGTLHWFFKRDCMIYDTTQDVPEYTPQGYSHTELRCIDPKHNHDDPDADNYCGFHKVSHELV